MSDPHFAPAGTRHQKNPLQSERAHLCAKSVAVHPLSITPFRLAAVRLLRAGCPASPKEFCLRLLPSGPDLVHSSSPRGTHPSTLRDGSSPTKTDLEGEFNPARAGCGFRAPLAPHLARPHLSLPGGKVWVKARWSQRLPDIPIPVEADDPRATRSEADRGRTFPGCPLVDG